MASVCDTTSFTFPPFYFFCFVLFCFFFFFLLLLFGLFVCSCLPLTITADIRAKSTATEGPEHPQKGLSRLLPDWRIQRTKILINAVKLVGNEYPHSPMDRPDVKSLGRSVIILNYGAVFIDRLVYHCTISVCCYKPPQHFILTT